MANEGWRDFPQFLFVTYPETERNKGGIIDKLYSYAGKLLRVDLTNEQIADEEISEETARKYIGGVGLGAKYLYEEVPAGVEWSDEANRLIIATGPLGGTTVGGSGTFCVVTKGPLTNGAASAQANGFFGAFLKFCGYDGIILQAKAKRWVYLYIDNGRVELRNASHLVGKDNWETGALIRDELGQTKRGMSVASIGPAGENLVKFACIFADKGHIASKNGVGAVMGSKKLKAIAIARGRERPSLKDKDGLSASAKQFYDNVMNVSGSEYTEGSTLYMHYLMPEDGRAPIRNYTTSIPDISPEEREKFGGPYQRAHFQPKRSPCWACRIPHCHMMTITEGPFKGLVTEEPEYETSAAFGLNIGITDVTAVMFLGNEADRLGIDCNETGWVISLAMECYEKGLLSLEDTDQIELTWGNYEAVSQMMQKIATRQGFGDILAEGAMRAAQCIGGEAPNFAIHTMKGNTPRSVDHRIKWPALFDVCLSQMGSDEGFSIGRPAELGLSIRPTLAQNTSLEDTLNWNTQCKGASQFEDCLGVCQRNTLTNIKLIAQAVGAATGWDFTAEEVMKVGRRVVNLLRVFNIRHGHTAEMDAPSPRYGSTPVDGPAQGKSIMVYWNELRSKYYEAMGWDRETGKPLPDTLKYFGLEHTIFELWGK